MNQSGQSSAGGNALPWAVVAFFVLVTLTKFVIASHLDLFFDEATYWQASRRLDAGYTHTLALTPLLIKAGTSLFGETLIGVRFFFLLIAAAIPIAVYWLAYPMVGRRDAILAGGVTLIMPVTGLLGEAYMDPPLILLTVLGLGAFDRARRHNNLLAWLAMGVTGALGLTVHYRFAPFLLGLLAYLLVTKQGRNQWKRAGLWVAGVVAALGLIPTIYFSIQSDFVGVSYQVVDRNPWNFQIEGFAFPLEQLAVVTPLLFLALMYTLVVAVRRARAGDENCALLVTSSIVYLGFYFVLAPFSDLDRMHIHWPAAGYVPLFVLLPGALRHFVSAASGTVTRKVRVVLCWLAVAGGAGSVCAGLFYLAACAWPSTLFPDFLRNVVRHELIQWSQLNEPLSAYLAEAFPDNADGITVVASSYQVGAEMEFVLRPDDGVFVLDHKLNDRHGYAPQLFLWDLDEASLRRTRPGRDALIIVESTDYWFDSARDTLWRSNLCSVFNDLRYLGEFEFGGGVKHMQLYSGQVRATGEPPASNLGPSNCASLPPAYMASPKRGDGLKGSIEVFGWALDDDAGIERVDVLVDGEVVGQADYGHDEPRVGEYLPGSTDPNLPGVGYYYAWDTTTLVDGPHQIAIRAYSADGRIWDFAHRTVFVDNHFWPSGRPAER